MTPEEKQAIIDKAIELGFKKGYYSFYVYDGYEENNLFIDGNDCYFSIGINITTSSSVKVLKSPEDLENLFNAITK